MKTPDANEGADDALDDLFRQRLSDYVDQPPTDALNRILAGANRPRPQLYLRWVPVSVAVLLLVGTSGWLYTRQSPVTQATKQTGQAVATTEPATRATNAVPADLSDRRVDGAIRERQDMAAVPKAESTKAITPPAGLAAKPRIDRQEVAVNELTSQNQHTTNLPAYTAYGRPFTEQNSLNHVRYTRKSTSRTLQRSAGTPVVDALGQATTTSYSSPDRYAALNVSTTQEAQTQTRLQPVEALTGRPFHNYVSTAQLPIVAGIMYEPAAEPQASRIVHRPSWFATLAPLYNYQQINPVHTDAEFVSDIRGAHALGSKRLGGRLQIGTEWTLNNRLRLRTSFVYQQVRQSLHYAVRSIHPDSIRIVFVDDQSVQVTPVFTKRNCSEVAIWHYAGVSIDIVWQLNRQTTGRWQHYLTAGATVGRYVARGGAVNGFIQASYGIERPLTPALRLRIEPTVQVGWEALTDAARRFQSRPYSYGLALGVRFK